MEKTIGDSNGGRGANPSLTSTPSRAQPKETGIETGQFHAPEAAASKVYEVLEGCRTFYDRGFGMSMDIRNRMQKLCETGSANPGVRIRVEEQGAFNIFYDGKLPNLGDRPEGGKGFWGPYVYNATNEFYADDLLKQLTRLDGINGYMGPVGAGDQHIMLLGALQRSHGNSLSNVRLCDINPAQIFMGIMTFMSYNNAFCLNELDRFTIGNRWGSMRAPELESPISVSLEHRDLLRSIAEASPDTYFIYLSNIPTLPFYLPATRRHCSDALWLNLIDSRKLLLGIVDNRNIQDGSCVMVSTVFFNDPAEPRVGNAVLEKMNGRLKMCANDGNFDPNRMRTYLAAMVDDEKFAWWLTSKLRGEVDDESDAKFMKMAKRAVKLRR